MQRTHYLMPVATSNSTFSRTKNKKKKISPVQRNKKCLRTYCWNNLLRLPHSSLKRFSNWIVKTQTWWLKYKFDYLFSWLGDHFMATLKRTQRCLIFLMKTLESNVQKLLPDFIMRIKFVLVVKRSMRGLLSHGELEIIDLQSYSQIGVKQESKPRTFEIHCTFDYTDN